MLELQSVSVKSQKAKCNLPSLPTHPDLAQRHVRQEVNHLWHFTRGGQHFDLHLRVQHFDLVDQQRQVLSGVFSDTQKEWKYPHAMRTTGDQFLDTRFQIRVVEFKIGNAHQERRVFVLNAFGNGFNGHTPEWVARAMGK